MRRARLKSGPDMLSTVRATACVAWQHWDVLVRKRASPQPRSMHRSLLVTCANSSMALTMRKGVRTKLQPTRSRAHAVFKYSTGAMRFTTFAVATSQGGVRRKAAARDEVLRANVRVRLARLGSTRCDVQRRPQVQFQFQHDGGR